jgi:hypothetical protein
MFYLCEKQIISQTEILEYSSVNENITNLGGLNNLKDWLKKRKTAFSIQASNYGLPTPRGLLLMDFRELEIFNGESDC